MESINKFNECSRCKKILQESELIVDKYWRCDNCISINLKERLEKQSPERGIFNE